MNDVARIDLDGQLAPRLVVPESKVKKRTQQVPLGQRLIEAGLMSRPADWTRKPCAAMPLPLMILGRISLTLIEFGIPQLGRNTTVSSSSEKIGVLFSTLPVTIALSAVRSGNGSSPSISNNCLR